MDVRRVLSLGNEVKYLLVG